MWSPSRRLAHLSAELSEFTSDDSSIVVFGSLARGEYTGQSDVDWTLLIDGQTYPEQPSAAADVAAWLKRGGFRDPGREATFGNLAFSHDLVHRIGGEADTNRNLTQRILLLLESLPVGRPDAYTRVIRALLGRYVREDLEWSYSPSQSYVPRFLQNDIARYWRTVAVDFAYKRRQRDGEQWALRTIKLRLSRKLTYAAGLVACFRCSSLPERHRGIESCSTAERAGVIVHELESFLRRTPLEMLAWGFHRFGLMAAAERFFSSYDRFLEMLGSEARQQLAALTLEQAPAAPVFQEALALGREFQSALDELFLPGGGGAFHDQTRTYGVF